jgi:hypothetical protein
MSSQADHILYLTQDLGIEAGPSLEATIKYCKGFTADCTLSDTYLELLIQSYHQGYQDALLTN